MDRLRELDDKRADGLLAAFDLHKLLEGMTARLNTGFYPVDADFALDGPTSYRIADWNARTVKPRMGLLAKRLATAEDFEAFVRARRARGR